MLLPTLERQTVARAEPAKIWKARSYIHDHLDEELSLTKIADFVGISSNHLSEKFKEVTGEKFVDYIARRRFQKACGLLQDRGLRISEIAFEVGFQSLSQFNRVFKKRAGQSPSQYRSAQCEIGKSHTGPEADAKETLTVKMRSLSSPVSATLRRCAALNGSNLAPEES
jgi:AraC-like DNA-binding protein